MKNSKKKETLKDIKNVTTKNVKSNSVPTYTPVSKHIYNTGVSYRVRVSVKGEMVSITTPTKKEAFRVRKELLGLRG